MSKRYPGNFITGNPVALSQTSNNGIWDVKDVSTAVGNSTWQEPSGIYQIGGSLRGRESASTYLTRTPTSSTSDGKTFTISAWVKRSKIGTYQIFFSAGATTITNGYVHVGFNSDDKLYLSYYSNASHVYSTDMLFRDPSAWYHMMLVLNTSTGAQGHKVYVNGEEVPLVRNVSYAELPANFASLAGRQAEHRLFVGSSGGGTRSGFLDGYMTEVNFVDGQALDPSYFGYTDSITGIWQPKRYTGTYGTNGFYLPLTSDNLSHSIYQNGTTGDYQTVSASNLADISSSTQTFTYEAWICPFAINASGPQGFRFTYLITKGVIYQGFGFTDTGVLRWYTYDGNTQYVESAAGVVKNGVWQHVAVVSTAGAIKLYANGTLVASGTLVAPSAGNNLNPRLFGGDSNFATDFFNGYCSNFRITNTAVYSSNFTPSRGPLTAISGTQFLGFQSATNIDSGPNGYTITGTGSQGIVKGSPFGSIMGYDASGTGSTFKPFNFGTSVAVSGSSFDPSLDSPTNVFTSATDVGGVVPGNYCTLSSIGQFSAPAITNGGLTIASTTTAYQSALASMTFPSTGKWYWEARIDTKAPAGQNQQLNFGNYRASTTGGETATFSNQFTFFAIYTSGNYFYQHPSSGGPQDLGVSAITGHVMQMAFDADTGKLWIGYNNNWFFSGNPTAGTNPAYTYSTTLTDFMAGATVWGTGGLTSFNFGQRPFSYTPPTGFKSLNTTNVQALGTSAIGKAAIQPNKWFDATTYVGRGSAQQVKNSGAFQPDLVWVKSRSNATYNHMVADSVRGAGNIFSTDLVSAEQGYAGYWITGFDSDGFTLGSAGANGSNASGSSYVGWQWKQSPTAGFNIVPYTGNGTARTITHNLGVAPSFMIVRNRTQGGVDTPVYHISTGNNGGNTLNESLSRVTTATWWNNTSPTSSNFTVGTGAQTNGNGQLMIAYLWAEVPGYSKFGSYIGNGSTDGPFIHLGFRPKYILMKSVTSGYNWYIEDTTRSRENPVGSTLAPNTANAEDNAWGSGRRLDITSNGFKIRISSLETNESGATFMYAAFAESPFALNNRAR